MAIPSRRSAAALALVVGLAGGQVGAQAPAPPASGASAAQERGPQALTSQAAARAIDALGTVDAAASGAAFEARTNAARALRRGPPQTVVPALIHAVESHANGYVRFRALVLLTGFNDPRTSGIVRDMMGNANDRLRTVAYQYFEHHPAPEVIAPLLAALPREESEFVRPALIRALAAQGSDPRVRQILLQEVGRGQDYFRTGVIEALGDYRATYALEPLLQIARLGGPLQIDAALAVGKLKDSRAMETLASLQRSAPAEAQPAIAAAICLLGVNCDTHRKYLVETLAFARSNDGFQELLRNTVTGLVALANAGDSAALAALVDAGVQAIDPPRAPIALGIGTIAMRNTPLTLSFLEAPGTRAGAVDLLGEGFDMLEEDYEEEAFFARVRRGYWQAAEGSPTRQVGQALIEKLEF